MFLILVDSTFNFNYCIRNQELTGDICVILDTLVSNTLLLHIAIEPIGTTSAASGESTLWIISRYGSAFTFLSLHFKHQNNKLHKLFSTQFISSNPGFSKFYNLAVFTLGGNHSIRCCSHFFLRIRLDD